MPVSYTIQAEVIDIRRDRPQINDRFLVDTNVWFWLLYPYASPLAYQRMFYPAYISKASSANAQFYRANLALAELAHLIERTERDKYNAAQQLNVAAKEYRHNYPSEHTNVVTQIQGVWDGVKQIAQMLPASIDDTAAAAVLARMPTEALDGYDLFIVEAMVSAGISQVITDDGDYVTVAGVQVFTANRNVLDQALAQGKLLVR